MLLYDVGVLTLGLAGGPLQLLDALGSRRSLTRLGADIRGDEELAVVELNVTDRFQTQLVGLPSWMCMQLTSRETGVISRCRSASRG